MKPYYINPFVNAAIKMIKKVTNLEVYKKNIFVRKGKTSLGGVGIVLNVDGDVKGKVVYEFSRGMTMQLSSRMVKKANIEYVDKEEFKKLLRSAIAELGNLISGRAITYLLKMGYNSKITPPKIYIGQGVPLIPYDVVTFVIELETIYGDFVINLAIEDQNQNNKEEADKVTEKAS